MSDKADRAGVLGKVFGGVSGLSEAWKGRHVRAMRDHAGVERRIDYEVSRYRLIRMVDELWNADVTAGKLEYAEADDREIAGYFRNWLDEAKEVADEFDVYKRAGYTFEREAEFRTCLENAVGLCTPDAEFFGGDAGVELKDQAVERYLAGDTVEMREFGD